MLLILLQIRSLRRSESGVAFIEFALSIFLLLLLFVGAVEIARYALIAQKLEKTVNEVADTTSQINPAAYSTTAALQTAMCGQIHDVMGAVTDMMSPYTAGPTDPNIIVILTDIQGDPSGATTPATPYVKWQYKGGGSGTHLSVVDPGGMAGDTANVSALSTSTSTFTLTPSEEVIVGEIFYAFSPMLNDAPLGGTFNLGTTISSKPAALELRYTGSLGAFVPASCPGYSGG